MALDQFVVMPDHIHGILFINDPVVGTGRDLSEKKRGGRDRPLQTKIKPLPEFVGAFKTTSSKLIRQTEPNFTWQRSYHDRIIRTDQELDRIRHYIFHNPHV